MKIIICATPFHVFTAMNIAASWFKEDKIIVIVLNYFSGSLELYNRMKVCDVFYKVCYIDVEKKDYYKYCSNKLYRFFYLMKSKWIIDEIEEDLNLVNEVLFPYIDPILMILGKEIQKKNINCMYSYFEDGVAAYIGDYESLMPARMELVMRVPLHIYIPNYIYTYSPEIYYKRNDISVRQVISDKKNIEKINEIFDYRANNENYRFAFLDTGIGTIDEIDVCIGILNQAFEGMDKERILVKKHPNRNDKKYEEAGYGVYCNQKGVPFEVCILNDEYIGDSILISDFSTASFSPKLIFGKEPILVFLYKIIDNGIFTVAQKKKFDCLIDSFRELYRDKSRIIVPNTINDFRKVVNEYAGKTVD